MHLRFRVHVGTPLSGFRVWYGTSLSFYGAIGFCQIGSLHKGALEIN
jgi:hypothetical protein